MSSVHVSAGHPSVRVFVSSTFRDMHAERDHLVTVVFPELRERLDSLGLEFFDVDLRWGVPSTGIDGERANSWEYCKRWIDRVEPFFIAILGQRYGWVPPAAAIRDEEERERWASLSVTEMEIRHAVLEREKLYKRSFFYFRESHVPPPPATDALVYDDFVDADFADAIAGLRTRIEQSGRPARPYCCRWDGDHFDDLEDFGRMVLEDLWSGVLRDPRYVPRDAWQIVLGHDPADDPSYADDRHPVSEELWRRLVDAARPAPLDPLDVEALQMERFADSRLTWFRGREHELGQLEDFIASTRGDAPHLAAVIAVPGQGKSSLLAKLNQRLAHTSAVVIAHFVGATESSASSHTLVERLLGELARSGIQWPVELSGGTRDDWRDFSSQCARLAQWLGDYDGERQIVILIDALDQLSDGQDLQWLPAALGSSARLIVSCVRDSEKASDDQERRAIRALELLKPAPLFVTLGPLTEPEVRAIAGRYLDEYCHELDGEHLDVLCRIDQAHNPLYLLVLLNELRTLSGNDLNHVVPALIASMPHDHPDAVSLFRWVVRRLGDAFGRESVRLWCAYLAHGRAGMSSHELADLMARKLGEHERANALRIERGLRRYLQRRGPQLDFFHDQLRRAVFLECGSWIDASSVHHDIADYFEASARGSGEAPPWETQCVRGFSECVFHWLQAGMPDKAAGLLGGFAFLFHKVRVGLLESALEDYELTRALAPADTVSMLATWSAFFNEHAHVLRRGSKEWPTYKILLQLAIEHADDSPITRGAEAFLTSGTAEWVWFRRVPRLTQVVSDPCLRVFEAGDKVSGAWVLDGGRLLSWSGMFDQRLCLWELQSGKRLARFGGHSNDVVCRVCVLSDGRLLSWSHDSALALWDEQNGTRLAALSGHSDTVWGALELADGRLLSWSTDHTLRIWDPRTAVCLSTLSGHAGKVWGALELSDGRLVSWGEDPSLRVWDSRYGHCLEVLEGHTADVSGAMQLADGRLLSWAYDGKLRLWDVGGIGPMGVFEGHSDAIRGALALPNGQVLSWAEDNTLRLWRCSDCACIQVFQGHSDTVWGAFVLSSGRLVSWSADKTLRVWRIEDGTCFQILSGHTRGVGGATEYSEGRLLSCSYDRTLRAWSVDSGECLGILEGHSGAVRGLLMLPDGRPLSWSEDGTLRIWGDPADGRPKALPGHTRSVDGVLMATETIAVSWSADEPTLRLWNKVTGACIATLDGHTEGVSGVLALGDGRFVSWSEDHTLRIWDGRSGRCLQILRGHEGSVVHAETMPEGRVVSWGEDMTKRIWDCQTAQCLLVTSEALRPGGPMANPEWMVRTLGRLRGSHETAAQGYELTVLERSAALQTTDAEEFVCAWQGSSLGVPRYLFPDGTAIVTQDSGQVCFLQLQRGGRSISLADLAEPKA